MTKEQAHQRIIKLRKLINYHRYLYHVLDKQEISDSALDSLKKELFDLEQKYPEFITPDSPTQRVGGRPLEKFAKVSHSLPMLSFNDAFSKQDIKDWEERIEKLLNEEEKKRLDYFCELKFDGLAIELVYENGALKVGSTRGDGLVGEDVTQNLKTIEAIPLRLKESPRKEIVVRGEALISKKEFYKINKLREEKGLSKYANPRNTAAGSLRQLDPKITASRNLDAYIYDLVSDLGQKTHKEEHEILKDLGFKVHQSTKFCRNLDEVFDYYDFWHKRRDSLPFEIDGLVVQVNDNKIFEKLGVVGKAPRGAIAYKFPLKQAQTIVEDIRVQVGRTGALTPVAHLKPVRIGGTTITRATLHNEDEIRRLGVKIGDTVIVGRAGDVIPDVVKVLPELRTGREKQFQMPTNCPICGTRVVKPAGEVVWRCPNPDCSGRQKRYFSHFVSKKAFDIEGLGPKIVEQLIKENLVSDPADLFELERGDLLPLERFAEKSAENLIKAIEKSKEINLDRFIYSLGIPDVGEETAAVLAEEFGGLKKLMEANLEQLQSIRDIGPETAQSIYSFFRNRKNLNLIKRLLKAGIKIRPKPKTKNERLKGKTFVFTGALKSLSREEAKKRVRELRGKVSNSVSKNTDFVVVGKDPGSKAEKAKSLGVRVLSEQEFLKIIGGGFKENVF